MSGPSPTAEVTDALDRDKIQTWPPLKKALWDVVTFEQLNDGHYINAYDLTDKLYFAATAAIGAGGQAVHSDDLAVDRFAVAMKDKLAQKRAEGRGGWENRDECSAEHLSYLLVQHIIKGDPLDVGNLAMMLHQRGDCIVIDDETRSITAALTHPAPSGQSVAVKPYGYANLYRDEDGDFRLGGVDVYPTPEPEWAEFADDYIGPVSIWPVDALAHPHPLPLKDEVERVLEPFAEVADDFDADGRDLADGDGIYANKARDFRAARALLSRLRAGAQEGWRPMDSAPRDGTQFLAFEKGRYFNCWCEYDPYEGGYFWMDDADSEPSPNLWQPLPAAPSPAKEGGR